MVWQDRRRLTGFFDLFAAHVFKNPSTGVLTVQEPVGFLVTDPNESGDHTAPAVVWDGTNYIIFYIYLNQKIYATVINGASSTLATSAMLLIRVSRSRPPRTPSEPSSLPGAIRLPRCLDGRPRSR